MPALSFVEKFGAEQDAPEGSPGQVKATYSVRPLVEVDLMVMVELPVGPVVTTLGDSLKEKSPIPNVKVVEGDMEPSLVETWTGNNPKGLPLDV